MLQEAIAKIESLTDLRHKANSFLFTPEIEDPRKIWYRFNGELNSVPKPFPAQSDVLDGVNDFIATVQKYSEGDHVIFVGHDAAILFYDRDERIDKAVLDLPTDGTFKTLEKLFDKPNITQEVFIRLLRRELRHADKSSAILQAVRHIKFRRNEGGHSALQHGNESMGREIEMSVTGADSIPEDMTVLTQVYRTPGAEHPYHVGLTIDINIKEQQFRVQPQEDHLLFARDEARAALAEKLKVALPDSPIFLGSPSLVV